MNLSIGPWYSSCVNSVKTKNFIFNYKPSHKKKCNVLQTWIWSCRHICNGHTEFLFSFLIFELCPYICHQSWSWKHCNIWNEMLLDSMLHKNSFVWINLTYCNIPDSNYHSGSWLGCLQKQFEQYHVRRSIEIFHVWFHIYFNLIKREHFD